VRSQEIADYLAQCLAQRGLKTHATLDIFPFMTDYELAGLAESIKGLGLIHPLVLSADGETLIDGRCRLLACKLAGVEPCFARIKEGDDEEESILRLNLLRASPTDGQLAIGLARAYPIEGTEGKYPKCGHERLRQARTVLRYRKDLAQSVAKIRGQ
jgi:ParB-like nuclease domain